MATFYEQRAEKFYIGEMTHYPFPLHVHEVVELVVLERGSVTMIIADRQYQLKAGDMAIIFPLVPHGYLSLSDDLRGLVAIFSPDLIADYAKAFHSSLPDSPVRRASALDSHIRLAVSRIRELEDAVASPFSTAYLHVLLAGVFQSISLNPLAEYDEPGLGYRIIHYVSDHVCENITLESTAHALGISISHLSHFFSQKIHINFRRFINSLRIDKARQLMRDPNMTLTTICALCGYTNIRTFRRAFLQETGTLPSDELRSQRVKTGKATNPKSSGQTGSTNAEAPVQEA